MTNKGFTVIDFMVFVCIISLLLLTAVIVYVNPSQPTIFQEQRINTSND